MFFTIILFGQIGVRMQTSMIVMLFGEFFQSYSISIETAYIYGSICLLLLLQTVGLN